MHMYVWDYYYGYMDIYVHVYIQDIQAEILPIHTYQFYYLLR